MITDYYKYLILEYQQSLDYEELVHPYTDCRYYVFSTNEWDYRVSIEGKTFKNFPSVGFQAKPKGSKNFNYDRDVVTNDGIYLVMNTISNILKHDFKNNWETEGYLFSTFQTKKGRQREQLYIRLLSAHGWTFERDEEYQNYITMKPSKKGEKGEKMKRFMNEQVENLNDNFIRWFNGSKVVDKNGNPLVVYHGSQSDFDQFMGDAYFTDDYMNADGYAGGEYVYAVYLSLKNPLIVDCHNRKWDDIKTTYGTTTRKVVYNVDRSKYDGVIFFNIKDSWIDDVDYQDASTIYVTFKPTQIKSTENDGTWNIEDENIYS